MGLLTIYSKAQVTLEIAMKIIVLVLLAAIVIALFSGLFFLAKDKDHPPSPRLLTALKVRVALSILLVVTLVVSYKMGWLTGFDG
jgi:hypothetical protein